MTTELSNLLFTHTHTSPWPSLPLPSKTANYALDCGKTFVKSSWRGEGVCEQEKGKLQTPRGFFHLCSVKNRTIVTCRRAKYLQRRIKDFHLRIEGKLPSGKSMGRGRGRVANFQAIRLRLCVCVLLRVAGDRRKVEAYACSIACSTPSPSPCTPSNSAGKCKTDSG